ERLVPLQTALTGHFVPCIAPGPFTPRISARKVPTRTGLRKLSAVSSVLLRSFFSPPSLAACSPLLFDNLPTFLPVLRRESFRYQNRSSLRESLPLFLSRSTHEIYRAVCQSTGSPGSAARPVAHHQTPAQGELYAGHSTRRGKRNPPAPADNPCPQTDGSFVRPSGFGAYDPPFESPWSDPSYIDTLLPRACDDRVFWRTFALG